MDDLNVSVEEAPGIIATLVDNFIALPVDFSDIPVVPEETDGEDSNLLNELIASVTKGDAQKAFADAMKYRAKSFDFDYLRGKILLSQKLYFEAAIEFTNALIKFGEYGEIWFLRGICQYQMGLTGDAFMDWLETVGVNKNHNDALLLIKLGAKMIKNTHKHLNPELMVMAPIVSGKGIDVGCGSAKTDPDCIGVDIIALGEKGEVASQKGLTSQADIKASGDDLDMFKDNELDYVIARHNLEHYDDPVATLAEWRRVLKPGGIIGLVLPDDDAFDTMSADETHKHPFTRSSLKKIIDAMAGIALIETGTSQNLWSFYAIIEKIPDGCAPSYNYRRKRNEWLSKGVSARIDVAMKSGAGDVASSAIKKLAVLMPGTLSPADPEKLYPSPSADKSYIKAPKPGGQTIAFIGDSPLLKDDANVLEGMGNAVYHLPLNAQKEIGYPMERRLGEIAPSFAFTFGFYPKLSKTLEELGIPYACWVMDKDTSHKPEEEEISDNSSIFYSSQEGEKYFKSLGAKNVCHLARGIDTSRFRPTQNGEKYCADISFADEPCGNEYANLLNDLRERMMDKECGDLEKNEIFKWIRKFGLVFKQQINELTHSKISGLWDEFQDGADLVASIGKQESDILIALGEEIDARQRLKLIGALGELSVNVWGDTKWGNKIGAGAIYRGTLDNDSMPALIYSNSKINIIKSKLGDEAAFGERFFEIMACKGFILADYREAYAGDDSFEIGKDFACYRTPEEAVELSRYYLDHPKEREAIARNGYSKTVENFSLKDRWGTIVTSLQKERAKS